MTLTSSAKEWKMQVTKFDYEMLLKKLIRDRIVPREKVGVDLSHCKSESKSELSFYHNL